MIKKYSVFGKVELVIGVTVLGRYVNIELTGGSVNDRGMIPASYTTNNPFVQKAIEGCPEFKTGIVKLEQCIPENSDILLAKAKEKAERERKAKEEALKAQEAERPEAQLLNDVKAEELQQPVPVETAADTTPVADAVEVTAEVTPVADTAEVAVDATKPTVEVAGFQDAVEYLKANYEGYTSSKLRSKAAVEHAAEEHGFVFVGL